MSRPLAERPIYALIDGVSIEVIVQLWAPERAGENWLCRYRFHSNHDSLPLNDGAGHGVDAMQALIEALHGIGWALDNSGVEWSMFSQEELTREGFGDELRDDGFPRAGLSVTFLGADFRKRIQEFVEGEKLARLKSMPKLKRPGQPN